MAEVRKVEVGFDGGQVLPLRLDDDSLEKLRGSLGDGGWQQVKTDDATLDISVEKVVFIRAAGDQHQIGF